MAKSCPLTCSQCSRNSTTMEVGLDGTALIEEDLLHGDVPDPERKWTSLIRNPLAAMERTESDGVSVDLYHAASVGPVDVFWLSNGSKRDEGPYLGAMGSLMFNTTTSTRTSTLTTTTLTTTTLTTSTLTTTTPLTTTLLTTTLTTTLT